MLTPFVFLLWSIYFPWTPLASTPQTTACGPWVQVNADAFGLPSGADHAGEEGFEVLVFADRLYLGMEADNSLGARLWRTRPGVAVAASQADWEEVIAAADGRPFGVANVQQNDHIDSLAEFDGQLYASTANGGDSTWGTRIFRSATGAPDTWQDALQAVDGDGDAEADAVGDTAGFGDPYNTNFKDMQVFQGQLCGGTRNIATGAQVWCTADGGTWTRKNVPGFGDPDTVEVWSGYVYSNTLFFGAQHVAGTPADESDDEARLYRTTSLAGTPQWQEVYRGAPGSYRVDLLGDLDGSVYIAVRSRGGIVVLRSPTGDAHTWTPVSSPGMNGDARNIGAVVDSATVYGDALFVSVFNLVTGTEVWRATSALRPDGRLDWQRAGSSGLGDWHNVYAELIPFNDHLYAWTSNYATGQQVRRTWCAPVDAGP